MDLDVIVACAALIVSLSAFAWSLYERMKLEKQKLAIDMLKEWNNNTSMHTDKINNNYPEKYNNCKPIDKEEVYKIVHAVEPSHNDEKDYVGIKAAIIRLLNYFEYVSSAYNRKSVDGKIIRNSFSVTMLRYYIVLRHFMIIHYLETSRNHWRPFTKHLKSLVSRREELICAGCNSQTCILKLDEENRKVKLLDLLNAGNLSNDEIAQLKSWLDTDNQYNLKTEK